MLVFKFAICNLCTRDCSFHFTFASAQKKVKQIWRSKGAHACSAKETSLSPTWNAIGWKRGPTCDVIGPSLWNAVPSDAIKMNKHLVDYRFSTDDSSMPIHTERTVIISQQQGWLNNNIQTDSEHRVSVNAPYVSTVCNDPQCNC